ncbi:hypothetical protein E2C01_072551 [Portunus trituberculatus]|uniref:Uncharacterized protein n=1 Tax=Portunus trituberculatus TaxID=210409 RepID=A0A5B7I852_PORTR|nr:hypothetical protein [Portunus trituberculatus]
MEPSSAAKTLHLSLGVWLGRRWGGCLCSWRGYFAQCRQRCRHRGRPQVSSVPEAYAATAVEPNGVLPVKERLHYQARAIPRIGDLVLHPHAGAGGQGWELSRCTVGHQDVASLSQLHLSLVKRSSPVPVYLEMLSGFWHPITQL